jgi:MoaA/NifB/PqqE/SkfB family radical SAM enzyme
VGMVASRNINVNIVTNSTLLTGEFLKTISEYKDRIDFILSLDGLEEETDSIRGKGVFKKVMEATDMLRKDKWRFLFTTVLMPLNFTRFKDYLEFVRKEFPETMVDIQPVIPHNEIYFMREKFTLPLDHLAALKDILSYLHEEARPQIAEQVFRKEHLSGIVEDVHLLWEDLIKNGYIHHGGGILDRFRNISDASEMILDARYKGVVTQVYSIMQEILKDQKKLRITRPFKVVDLYWDYFNNTLHTNNQCKMGIKSFNINRSGNLWICGKELEYPLYQHKIEEVFATVEYQSAMQRVEKCTSPCFAGLVV